MHSIIRTKKHKSILSLKSRMTHTFRTRPTPNADPSKLNKNKLLWGNENYADEIDKKLKEYEKNGNHIRSDAVLAIEYLLTASPEFFDEGSKIDRERRLNQWVNAQIEFMKEKHGAENIACMYLHLDEKTPHIECLVLPIDHKKKLNCKYFLGGSQKMTQLQTEYSKFNEKMGLKRGVKGSRATHTTIKKFYEIINRKASLTNEQILEALKLDKPTMKDMLNGNSWLENQQSKILKELKKLLAPYVYENKQIELAKQALREQEKMIKEKEKTEYTLEKRLEEMKVKLLEQAEMLDLIEKYKEKLEIEKSEKQFLLEENEKLKQKLKDVLPKIK